jgi:hypothetical protein
MLGKALGDKCDFQSSLALSSIGRGASVSLWLRKPRFSRVPFSRSGISHRAVPYYSLFLTCQVSFASRGLIVAVRLCLKTAYTAQKWPEAEPEHLIWLHMRDGLAR